MRFVYTTEESEDYNFAKLGGVLEAGEVELTFDAYMRFQSETEDSTHRLVLHKESPING